MGLLRGLIAGGVRNPVLVNLLMVCILAGGFFSARRMVREAYPEFELDHIAVEVAYPGASPDDVERSICTPIEEALQGLRGMREISSSANPNYGTVFVALSGEVSDPAAVMKEIKDRVDQITDFPAEAKRPIVRETFLRGDVINVTIYGDLPERTLKAVAREVRDDLTSNAAISQVSLSGVRGDEIIIEVSDKALDAYHLSLEQVMAVVAQSSLDLPAGLIRTADEELTLRVKGQRYYASDYEGLVILERGNTVVRLGEIATVREGFEEAVVRGRFNGLPAVVVQVFKTAEEDAKIIAAIVQSYVASRQVGLPDALKMSVWADGSRDIDDRIAMLLSNGIAGVLLVFLTLALFLELRVALWVSVGIPVSFAGALIIMYLSGSTLNMISLFALFIVSGIIVDDAIVIADSIFARRRAGEEPVLASINGTSEVALPVLGASVTTIVTFVPLLYISGVMGRFIYILPVVVIGAICASAIEAFGVLPSHLCHRTPPGVKEVERKPTRMRVWMDGAISGLIEKWYRPAYRASLRGRYATVCIAVMLLLISAGLVLGGRTPTVLFPKENANIVRARVRMPEGTPARVTAKVCRQLEDGAQRLNNDPELVPAAEGPLVQQVYTIMGEFAEFLPIRGNNLCETRIELMPAERRDLDDEEIMDRWRFHIGKVYDAVEFRIARVQLGPTDRPIEIRLLGHDLDDMASASVRIQDKLREFEGATDVGDDLIPGRRELRVTLKPSARTLGLTLDDVAKQLRHGFFGGEAVKLRRGREEVTVRVRYPEDERRSILDLENMRITTAQGAQVPFFEVVELEWGRGLAMIMHQAYQRRVRVLADVDDRVANAEQIMQTLEAGFLDEVVADYNEMTWQFGGDRERMAESMDSLAAGFKMALLVIYTILAGMLRSYIQPIVILMAVPLGFVGAVLGHTVLGMDLTLMSMFGLVALSGVVVNDSLVLVDVMNRGIREGKSVIESVFEAGERRFRAVVLTSITTIVGLAPILLEQSSQAQSVKPMAVSLTFGLLAATVLTLFVVPSLFLITNDARRVIRWLRFGGAYPVRELVEDAAHDQWMTAGRE